MHKELIDKNKNSKNRPEELQADIILMIKVFPMRFARASTAWLKIQNLKLPCNF